MKPPKVSAASGNARERLIAVATRLFAAEGPAAVSVKEISEQAHINVSLISYYFGGKDGLLDAVFEGLAESHLRDLDRVLVKVESRRELRVRLTLLLRNLVKFYVQHKELIRLFLGELEHGQAKAEKVYGLTFQRIGDRLEAFLKEAMRAGYLKQTDVRILRLQIFSPITHLMRCDRSAKRFYQMSLSEPPFRRQLIAQVVNGVLHEERARAA